MIRRWDWALRKYQLRCFLQGHLSVKNEMKKSSLWSTTDASSAVNINFMICLVEFFYNFKYIWSSFDVVLWIVISNRGVYVNDSLRLTASLNFFNVHKFSFHVSRSLKADNCSNTLRLQLFYVFRTVEESSDKKIICDCVTREFISKNIRFIVWILNCKGLWDHTIKDHISSDSSLYLDMISDKMVSNNLHSHIYEESSREQNHFSFRISFSEATWGSCSL